MRRLLLIGLMSLSLGLSAAEGATRISDLGPISDMQFASAAQMATPYSEGRLVSYIDARNAAPLVEAAWTNDATTKSIAMLIWRALAVAGAGLVATIAAVGVKSLWVQNPIRYYDREGSA